MTDEPSEVPEPQSVLGPLSGSAIFLVVTVDEGGEESVRDVLADLSGLRRSYAFGAPGDALNCVAGIGSDVWGRLFDGPRPAELHPFRELVGPRHHAVSTPGDLLFHIRSERQDLCFALASEIMDRLRGAVTVVDEVQGFKYYEVRDLLGFVDGTENPEGVERAGAVLIDEEDADFAGGSYVIVQKYLHDLQAWNALPVEGQEKVIGRRKATNVELDEPASHVSLNTVLDEDGEELQILRDNMPFGSPGREEFGTYFIGYSRTPEVTEQMLRNMFLGTDAASHDRILDFSTAVTGSLFFTPAAGFLDDLPDPPSASVSEPASASASEEQPVPHILSTRDTGIGVPVGGSADGSLGIGDLNRSTAK